MHKKCSDFFQSLGFKPLDTLKRPLIFQWGTILLVYYNQLRTSKVSYSPKRLIKIVIPEIVFISHFNEGEIYKMYPKIVYLAILTNF